MSDSLDNFYRTMKRAQMTDTEKTVDDISSTIAGVVLLLLFSTAVWAILHLIFVLPVTWLQVLGGFLLFNLARSLFR